MERKWKCIVLNLTSGDILDRYNFVHTSPILKQTAGVMFHYKKIRIRSPRSNITINIWDVNPQLDISLLRKYIQGGHVVIIAVDTTVSMDRVTYYCREMHTSAPILITIPSMHRARMRDLADAYRERQYNVIGLNANLLRYLIQFLLNLYAQNLRQ